jgi:hypothetical protein
MHIKIDENNKTSVLCLERGHEVARILYCEEEHIHDLVQIAQSLGAKLVMIEVEVDTLGMWEDMGFHQDELVVGVYRLINETKSKRS